MSLGTLHPEHNTIGQPISLSLEICFFKAISKNKNKNFFYGKLKNTIASLILDQLKIDSERNTKIFSYQSCFPIDTKPYNDILKNESSFTYEDILLIAREHLTKYTWVLMHFDNIGDDYNEATGPYKYFLEYTIKPEHQE